MANAQPVTVLGSILIVIGIILVVLPVVTRHIPSLEKLPWIILWVYKSNGFLFATSPVLIIITIVSLLVSGLKR